jgi:DNA (cytosine-5)-methyltransferase 1
VKPRLLDLFCCQGGASMGYYRAGFEVVGVDIEPQPRYPFEFVQADALDPPVFYDEFDAVHASPPCQAHTKAQRVQDNAHPELIGPVRELLKRTGLPYVIENVPGAPLEDPIELCGTMFGLPLYRHRLFECSFPVTAPLHGGHWLKQVKMGRKPGPDEIPQPVGHFSDVEGGRRAMEMPWASQDGLREAIPPAYTEHIGGYLMAAVRARATA